MTSAIALVAYAVLTATAGAWLLRRAVWPTRAPLLGIAAWQALCISSLSAVILASLTLTLRLPSLSTDLAGLLRACVMNVRAGYATPGGALTTTVGLALAAALTARAVWGVVIAVAGARRERTRQLHILHVLGRHDHELDALVVAHATAAVFCFPGRHHRVVLTTAALQALNADELTAVLAHERAHLRGRHHLVVASAQGLARAFPTVPLFRWCDEQVRRLVEMAADDAASRRSDVATVASALVTLAHVKAPPAALAAAGETAQTRAWRLLGPLTPLGRARRFAVGAGIAATLLVPLAIAITPALAAARLDYCVIAETS